MPAKAKKVVFSALIESEMKTDQELFNQIEAYLKGELNAAEEADFERYRNENPDADQQFTEYSQVMGQLKTNGYNRQLLADMDAIHKQLDIEGLKEKLFPQPSGIVSFFKKYRLNIAVAASVAIVAAFATMFSTGYFSKASLSNYKALRRELSMKISNIERSQNALINNIKGKPTRGPVNPVQFGGTGFALSADGYVVTNYHVIKGADSVYIQNSAGESFKVKQIYVDPAYDIAVLQIIDTSFTDLDALPYSIKEIVSDIGEDVFTIGFPRDSMVYGKGYLSSRTGYNGDTVAYQVSIPVNPGDSGGPLLDSRGNVIGIINGKQTQADGVAFAIKSNYLLKSLEAIPQDSLEEKLVLNKRNNLNGLSRKDQIKKMQDYIFMVKVY